MYLGQDLTIYLVAEITNMRKQINRLPAIAQTQPPDKHFTGCYFVFMGKTRHVVKILYWDRSGFCQRIIMAQSRLLSEQQKITKKLKKHIDQLREQTSEEHTCQDRTGLAVFQQFSYCNFATLCIYLIQNSG